VAECRSPSSSSTTPLGTKHLSLNDESRLSPSGRLSYALSQQTSSVNIGERGCPAVTMISRLLVSLAKGTAAVREGVDYVVRDVVQRIVVLIRYVFYQPVDGKSLHEHLSKNNRIEQQLVWLDDLERFAGAGRPTAGRMLSRGHLT
jgi:hypothetical protein